MTSVDRLHDGGMEHHEDPVRPGTDARVELAFADMVRALTVDDPRFVHRVTRPAFGRLGVGNAAIVAGLLATVVLGVLPLAVGLHTGIVALLAVGALGCVVLPVAVPLSVRAVVRRRRPLAM